MIAVILAGGSGTRFWPLSRADRPKQLISLFGGKPMIVHTLERVQDCVDTVLVVTGEPLLEATRAALGLPGDAYIVEPAARNTAPAIGLAAVECLARYGDDPIAILPSDHFVRDAAGFRAKLLEAAEVAKDGWITTLGISPTHPETGYGYIRYDRERPVGAHALAVEGFVEKPDHATAIDYVTSGRYAWNAGIFVFRPSVMLHELERQKPDIRRGLSEIEMAHGRESYEETVRRVFPTLEKISIDYAVMEGAERIAVIPADVGWSDVGHWASMDAVSATDEGGNVTEGLVVVVDTSDSVVFNATDHAVTAVVGLEGYVVVHTHDAVLVIPRDRAQDVRAVVAEIQRRGLGYE